jgi:hypothetical protein
MPSSTWRYASRWSRRFNSGAQSERRVRIAEPATGNDLVTTLPRFAKIFGMTDEAWQRHANPWSVHTRFAAIPAGILAICSRTWLGWWALVPVGLVIVWLWLNPHVFPAVREPRSWAAKGIYGEKLWLNEPESVSPECRSALRWLIIPGVVGMLLLAWGLAQLDLWPTIFGATLVTLAQLWRIDRLGLFYEQRKPADADAGN